MFFSEKCQFTVYKNLLSDKESSILRIKLNFHAVQKGNTVSVGRISTHFVQKNI